MAVPGQGTKAPAFVYPVIGGVPAASNTDNMVENVDSTQNVWASHVTQPDPHGFGGSR